MSRFFIILTHPFVRCGSTSKGATFNKLIYRINRITFIERRQGQFLQPRRHSHRLDLLSLPGTGRLHAMNGSLLEYRREFAHPSIHAWASSRAHPSPYAYSNIYISLRGSPPNCGSRVDDSSINSLSPELFDMSLILNGIV